MIGAQLTLAKMYAKGLYVRRSDANAFYLYRRIYQDYREGGTSVRRGSPAEKHIAQAYIELAKYYLKGLKQAGLPPDFNKALELLEAASINFADPDAQYMLAKMYLAGKGVNRNVKRAIRWLSNASRDHDHAPSHALLAEILWEGKLVRRQPVRALALITLARDNASPRDASWITAIYDTIINESNGQQKLLAANAVSRWVKQRKENTLRIEQVRQRQRELVRRNNGRMNVDQYNVDFLKPKSIDEGQGYYNTIVQKQSLRGTVDAPVPVTGKATLAARGGLLAAPARSRLRNIDTPFAYGVE